MRALTILHTNDLHAKLTIAKAERIRLERASVGSPALLLDAGDAIGSGNATFRPDGDPALDLMSDTGYDAMAVGNREFHFTQMGFHAKARRARFPMLSANVRSRSDAIPLPCIPLVRFDDLGLGSVCVFGLTVPMITERMSVKHLSPYVFDDPFEAAKRVVTQERPACDLLVCLSHCGLAVDRRLAATVRGLDIIIGGHTHAELPTGEMVEGTLIAHAGSHARWLGRVHVAGEPGDWQLAAELVAL